MSRRRRERIRSKMLEILPLPPTLEAAFLAVERMPRYADAEPSRTPDRASVRRMRQETRA